MIKRTLKWLISVVVILGLIGVAAYFGAKAIWADTDPPPEFAAGRRTVGAVRTSTTMAVAANPHAAKAAHEMLQAGGSAIDAAIAAQAVLTLVEPQSSGIAGGAFLLFHDASANELLAYDGRETAPAGATPDLFMHADGTPFNFMEAVVGGRSVGVPGVLRMLELAHREHGRLPWARLFEPAIRLSEGGFEVSSRLHAMLRFDPLFRTQPEARAYLYQPDGRALAVGTVVKNPALGRTLQAIAEGGADVLYEGRIAEAIVERVQQAQRPSLIAAGLNFWMINNMGAPYGTGWLASVDNPGSLTLADLKAYQPKKRAPVCVEYRAWKVCGFGPPTSGGITSLQIIKMLERFDIKNMPPKSVEFAHVFVEACKLAYADRARYIGDPDFVDVPTAGLLDPKYLAERAQAIDPKAASTERAQPGQPAGLETAFADNVDRSLPSTSHLVVVDDERNVVSMTTSVENVFGSRMMVEGFVLNNQLTDFSFRPEVGGRPVANAVAAHKRPRSSMNPLIAFDRESGAPVAATGSPGGSRIIVYSIQSMIGMLDHGLTPQAAVDLPHIVNRNGRTELENGGWEPGELDAVKRGLEGLGHEVVVNVQNSGIHALRISADGLLGGADPRREGLAVGD